MKKILISMAIFLMPIYLSAQQADTLSHQDYHRTNVFYGNQYSLDSSNVFKAKESFSRNFTYAGFAIIADGFVVKARKRDFRSMRTYFKPNFKTTADNYSQYAPLAVTFALKAAGVKSASSWKRMTVNSALSYAAMAAIVNSVKYTVKEMRPDNSEANSFPSGHTATAFAGATILHKEYGYLSPWYSIGGYLAATATGISRIMNNRHWISDVLVGAGVGIVSTDLGYFLGDLLMKGKGLEHQRKYGKPDISYRPSFISLTVGTGVGPNYINAPDIYDNYDVDGTPTGHPMNLKLKTGRVVSFNVEGAYYLNDYVGVGGRLRAMTIPFAVESFNSGIIRSGNGSYVVNPSGFGFDVMPGVSSLDNLYVMESLESEQLGMIDLSAGIFLSIPVTPRFRIGTKFLVGNQLTTGFSVDALFRLNNSLSSYGAFDSYEELKEFFDSGLDEGFDDNGKLSRDELDPDLYHEKDFMKVRANNTITFGTGVDFTYAYKDNVSLKMFFDYDYARPNYTYELNNRYNEDFDVITDTFKKHTTLNLFTGGIGMEIYF